VVPLVVVDDAHAFARWPAGGALGPASEAVVEVSLEGGEGSATVRLINDTSFPDLTAMVSTTDGSHLVIVSPNEDRVYAVDVATRRVRAVSVGDGPSAVTAIGGGRVLVSHLFSPSLISVDLGVEPPVLERLPGPRVSASLATNGGLAFVTEQARDTVAAVGLDAGCAEVWRTPVAPNPRAMVVTRSGLVVGSLQTGELELLDVGTGRVLGVTQPGPGTPIIGGGTAAFSNAIMNGKAPRALVASERLGVVFGASIGPNIGPNAEKHEVSMNGGVGVVSLPSARAPFKWVRHLGFGAGVTDALALDDEAGLLYAADVSLGLVRVLDARRLARSDADAAKALVQELALPPPPGFPSIRPAEDFNVKGRAGPSLHSGPKALVLSTDRRSLFVLNRFTGTLATLDVAGAAKGRAVWVGQVPITDVLAQKTRRLGQVLYFADLGRTAMSCDACHLEGHGEGVLFEKTNPLRIYRSTTVRGARETPPYFTPASTHSMGETAKIVGSRNRFQNPVMSDDEIDALTLFTSLIPTVPNPFVGDDGAPVAQLTLPDGAVGSPRRGLSLYESKAGCAECHPAPLFTTDQDEGTRGRFIDVGTPKFMPLRPEQQDTRFEGFAPPSLLGAWDVFPMLTTGLAGLEVREDGSVVVRDRFPLRVAVERWAPSHGRADQLSAAERNDLLAWLMSL
jgi:hypothetical protein